MGFSNFELTDYLIVLCIFALGIVVGRITMAFQIAYMKDRAYQIRRSKELEAQKAINKKIIKKKPLNKKTVKKKKASRTKK